MIRIVVDRVFSGDLHYQEMFGLSTDTKPTEGLITGSKFTETDTGDVYLLEEGENAEWHKSAEGPGSGGGGGGVDGGNYYVHFMQTGATTGTCDKTMAELEEALASGKNIVAIYDPSNQGFSEQFGRLMFHVKDVSFTFIMNQAKQAKSLYKIGRAHV